MTDCLSAPLATLPSEALLSKSYEDQVSVLWRAAHVGPTTPRSPDGDVVKRECIKLTLLASPMARLTKSFLPPLLSLLPEVNFLRACMAAAVPMALTLLLLSPLL